MKIDTPREDLVECFKLAERDEKKGKKHKGLLITSPREEEAKQYIKKAKQELELCNFYKEKGFDYKIPEEWFYTLYYCALAILSKFGIESRSQRCTALLLRYLKDNKLIEYDDEFINRISVHKEKGKESDVDEREKARYSPMIKIEKVEKIYNETMQICKKAISQAEDIIYSNEKFEFPKDFENSKLKKEDDDDD